jgi:hypothetical protein
MSEKSPQLPPELSDYNRLEAQVASASNPYDIIGQKMNEAAGQVNRNRNTDAALALINGRENNRHANQLSEEERDVLSQPSRDNQELIDRIAGEGAYDARLTSVVDRVNEVIDTETRERANDTEAFWSGDNGDNEPTPTEPPEEGEPTPTEPPEEGEPTPTEPPEEGEPTPTEIVKTPELVDLEIRLDEVRDRLARFRATRESRTVTARSHNNEEFQQILEEYQQLLNATGVEAIRSLMISGVTDEQTLASAANFGAADEYCKLTQRQMEIELEDTENRKLGRFYDFWARNSGHKLLSKAGMKAGMVSAVKKAAVFAPVGIAAGILAGPAMAMGGAAAAGGFVATRISRGLMGAKASKEADRARLAQEKAQQRWNAIREQIDETEANGDLVESAQLVEQYRDDTNEWTRRNRKAAVKAAGTAALLGGVTSAAISGIDFKLPENPFKSGGSTEVPTPDVELTPEANQWIKWSLKWEAENPTLTTPNGEVVYQGTAEYLAEKDRLWSEWFSTDQQNAPSGNVVQDITDTLRGRNQ